MVNVGIEVLCSISFTTTFMTSYDIFELILPHSQCVLGDMKVDRMQFFFHEIAIQGQLLFYAIAKISPFHVELSTKLNECRWKNGREL